MSERPAYPPALVVAALALSAAPLLAYATLLFSVSSNVPYLDDYDVILAFLNDWVASDGLAEQIALPFSQHVEHRMAFLRGLALASYGFGGGVDFHSLNLIGSLGLLVLAALLFLASDREDGRALNRIVVFTPVPLLLFQPQYWDCLLWPTSSLANFWVVAFALASALLVVRRGAFALGGALLCALLATFSQGNGMLVLLLGALALALAQRWRDLGIWSAIALVVLVAYFHGYESPPGPGPLAALFKGWEPIAYALNLLGSGPALATPGASLAVGALGLLSALMLLAGGLARRNLPLFLLLLFVLGSVAANSLSRTALGGPLYPLQSPRYQFFSCVFWVINYLAWIEWAKGRTLAVAAATVAAAVFSLVSFERYSDDVERVSQRMQRGMLVWTTRGSGLVFPDEKKASRILQRAIDGGVYVIPIDDLLLSTPIESAPGDAL